MQDIPSYFVWETRIGDRWPLDGNTHLPEPNACGLFDIFPVFRGMADGGFTLERKFIGDKEGRWGEEIYLTSPDGKTYGGGAIVAPP